MLKNLLPGHLDGVDVPQGRSDAVDQFFEVGVEQSLACLGTEQGTIEIERDASQKLT